MEKRRSFDFGRLLMQHEKKHKQKPPQFESLAGGVQKRLETRLKTRKSNRFSIFDSIRNLSRTASPAPVPEAQNTLARRLQQLKSWKEEKEKKKKEAAAKRKKPFLVGVPHTSHKYVPPPPPPAKPSTSRRVTRSQTARNTKVEKAVSQSFAPKNATFKPPELKNNSTLPFVSLVPLKLRKSKVTFTFDPVLPKKEPDTVKQVGPSRSRAQIKQIDTKVIKKKADKDKKNDKNIKTAFRGPSKTFQSSSSSEADSSMPLQKTFQSSSSSDTDLSMPLQKTFQSSSSSDTDSSLAPRNRKPLPAIKLQSTSTESESSLLSNTEDKFPNQRRTRQSQRNLDPPILVSKTPRKSTPSASEQITPKKRVPKSESSSEERLRPSKSPLDVRTPEQIIDEAKRISPCVTMSRGKDNARREMKKKLDEGLLDEDTADVDNIDHFRRQLASEIKRMTEMCELWDRVLEQAVLPDSVQENILSAVGQARLLMTQKLQQFAGLVERCARPDPGSALITPADLQGFWDMVFMQIENVDVRFKKLEELRARNWTEEQVVVAAKKKVVKAAPVKAKPTGGASRIREIIAAARKAKKDQLLVPGSPASPAEKSFEAGFFCVTSPIRSSAPATPRSKLPTLLKAVLSSEAKKSASKNSASFAILRASVLGKNADYEGISPLPQTPLPTNMNATPGRSILKKSTASVKKSSKKSIKVVLFNQSGTELNTSLDNLAIDTTDLTTSLDDQPIEKTNSTTSVDDQPIETIDSTTSLDDQPIETQEEPMGNIDSRVSSMDIEQEEKENLRTSPRLTRQDAIDLETPQHIAMMTRSRRKSMATPQLAKTAQEKKKTPQENMTPQGRSRRSTRKAQILVDVPNDPKENKNNPQENITLEERIMRSTRKATVLLDVLNEPQENKNTPQVIATPQGRSRRSTRKAKVLVDVLNDL